MGLYTPDRRADRGVPALVALFSQARPALPPGFRYALLQRTGPNGSPRKPMAFQDLGGLARHIHRARGQAGVQLADAPMMLWGRETPEAGVSVWILDPATGDRRTYLGWAWVNGAGRVTLEAALQAEQPGPGH